MLDTKETDNLSSTNTHVHIYIRKWQGGGDARL